MNQMKYTTVHLCILLLAQPIFSKYELFSPNIATSEVYVNSLAQGSQTQFAIDDDFVYPHPTCLKTNPDQPDNDGSHWVMIDFGLILRNVKEIRLAPDPSNKIFATKLSNIDAYIVRSGQYFNLFSEQNQNPKIPWNSNAFQLCSNSGNVVAGTRVASIECPEPLNGRWLALRKSDGDLNICLVSVYIQDAFHECFELQPIDPTGQTRFVGQVFQFIRHVTLSVCRSACSSSKSCQAIMFKKRGRSGICELIDEFHVIETPLKDRTSENRDLKKVEITCNTENCSIEVNHCHLGTLEELQKSDSILDDEIQSPDNFMNEQILQDWELDPVKQLSTNALDIQSRFLLSVHLEGLMDCRSSNCGLLNVYSIDLNEEIDLCGSVDSRLVRRLDKHYVFCRSDPPIVGTQKIRLSWTNLDRHEYQVNISAVHLRTTFDEMTFLRRVNKNLVKIDPEVDEEDEEEQIIDARPKDEGLESPEIFEAVNFTNDDEESRNIVFHPREVSDYELTTAAPVIAITTSSAEAITSVSATKDTKSVEEDHEPLIEPKSFDIFQTNTTSYHTRGDTMRKRDPSSMVNTLESASLDYLPEVIPKSRNTNIHIEQRDEPQNRPPLLSGASKKLIDRISDQKDKEDENSGAKPAVRLVNFIATLIMSIIILGF